MRFRVSRPLRDTAAPESLDVQRRQIEGHALIHSFALDNMIVEEGVSGSVPVAERPRRCLRCSGVSESAMAEILLRSRGIL